MNRRVILSTPCTGDCAAAAYVMNSKPGHVTDGGFYWDLNKPFLKEVQQCRVDVAEYMEAHSMDLRNADIDDHTERQYADEIIVVRTKGAYVDVMLFYTALANLKNIKIILITSDKGWCFDDDFDSVETNQRTITSTISIIQQRGTAAFTGETLVFAHAGPPSNHIYATESIASTTASGSEYCGGFWGSLFSSTPRIKTAYPPLRPKYGC